MRIQSGLLCIFLALAPLAYALDAGSPPVLAPQKEQAQAARFSAQFLSRYGYKPVPLDDALSAKIMDRFIKSLDPDRVLFLQTDIDTLWLIARRSMMPSSGKI
jgi:carboxyl-terminal processing protease